MIIFTSDPEPFQDGKYITMYGKIDTIPTLKETTYILHSDKFSSDDVISWSPMIRSRLVVVTDKPPNLNKQAKELCVVDDKLKGKSKDNTFLLIKALMNWDNRDRVKALYVDQPTPLVLWFLRGNNQDIELWRRISKVLYTLPEDYLKATLIYSIKPSRKKVVWPKKEKKGKDKPMLFRSNDQHWEILLDKSISIANQVRDEGDIPKGMRRTKQRQRTWF